MYEPGQRVPLAAQIERRGTNGLAEHSQHPKPLPHRHLSSISRRALLQVFDNEADILQSQWTAINVGEFKRSVAQYSRLWRQRKAYGHWVPGNDCRGHRAQDLLADPPAHPSNQLGLARQPPVWCRLPAQVQVKICESLILRS